MIICVQPPWCKNTNVQLIGISWFNSNAREFRYGYKRTSYNLYWNCIALKQTVKTKYYIGQWNKTTLGASLNWRSHWLHWTMSWNSAWTRGIALNEIKIPESNQFLVGGRLIPMYVNSWNAGVSRNISFSCVIQWRCLSSENEKSMIAEETLNKNHVQLCVNSVSIDGTLRFSIICCQSEDQVYIYTGLKKLHPVVMAKWTLS